MGEIRGACRPPSPPFPTPSVRNPHNDSRSAPGGMQTHTDPGGAAGPVRQGLPVSGRGDRSGSGGAHGGGPHTAPLSVKAPRCFVAALAIL
ncbi:unnamed protein product [Closterium sp. NIES-54]